MLKDFENSVEAGFQMACAQGPLCAEPVVGMGWVVQKIEWKDAEEGEEGTSVVGITSLRFRALVVAEPIADAWIFSRQGQNKRRARFAYLQYPRCLQARHARLESQDQAGHVHL